ncbi:uncharacterized protein TNCV_5092991 [Trichonephila clavipes]|nr:uncharacterized protein TNCV_5092991 [Trichonephila clavipes]
MESNSFECLLVEQNSILLVCAAKVRLLELQDADHERDTNQTNLTRDQYATYPANKLAKEKVASDGLHKCLEQSLQHVDLSYLSEICLPGCIEGKERLQAVEHFTDVSVVIEITLNSQQIGSSMMRNRTPNHKTGCMPQITHFGR